MRSAAFKPQRRFPVQSHGVHKENTLNTWRNVYGCTRKKEAIFGRQNSAWQKQRSWVTSTTEKFPGCISALFTGFFNQRQQLRSPMCSMLNSDVPLTQISPATITGRNTSLLFSFEGTKQDASAPPWTFEMMVPMGGKTNYRRKNSSLPSTSTILPIPAGLLEK